MDPHLVVRLVQAPDIDAASQVQMRQTGLVGILRVNLGKRDVHPSVRGPRTGVRQLIDRGFVGEHRPATDEFGPRAPGQPRRLEVEAGATACSAIDRQLNQPFQGPEQYAEDETDPHHRAEKVADHGEPATLDAGIVDGRSARLEHAALDLRRFQIGIDRLIDPNQLLGGLQLGNARHSVR